MMKTTKSWQEENGIALDQDQNQIHDYDEILIIQTVTNYRWITAASGGNAPRVVAVALWVGDHKAIAIKVVLQVWNEARAVNNHTSNRIATVSPTSRKNPIVIVIVIVIMISSPFADIKILHLIGLPTTIMNKCHYRLGLDWWNQIPFKWQGKTYQTQFLVGHGRNWVET